jgi:ATP-dependent DNA helicase PIF1
LNSSIIFEFNEIETTIMSEFDKSLDTFKYDNTNSSETKQINIGNTSSPTVNNNLDITELSIEQKYAYRKFVKGENLFITGPGGTGKTHLIKHLLEFSTSIKKDIPVCAMTGCAAVLLECNARTLHSWSGIKLAKGESSAVVTSVLRNKHTVRRWQKAKGLILDEVSMLSKKIFEIIEKLARVIKKDSRPFGGMQLVFTGDFFQLPPVGTSGEDETSQFCFESSKWTNVFKPENHIELKTMFRQTDPVYIDILHQIRRGYLDEDKQAILEKYIKRKFDSESTNGCVPTKLFPLRSKTDYVNAMMFKRLTDKEYVSEAIRKTDCTTRMDSNKPLSFETIRKCRELSENETKYELDLLMNSIPSAQVLRLKKGAAVMCTVNLDMDNSICNGSQGVITDIKELANGSILPIVRFSNGIEKTIQLHHWQSEEYPTLAIGQYPLCLAWALTIHKIQGATLNMAEMDIGQSIFEYGQSYVALSRVRSLDGLYLSAFNSKKIGSNPKVIEFYNIISQNTLPQLDETEDNDVIVNNNTSGELLEEETYGSKDVKVIKL